MDLHFRVDEPGHIPWLILIYNKIKNILDIQTNYVYNPNQPIKLIGIKGKGEGQMKRYAKMILKMAECCCCCMMQKYHIAYLPCIS